MFNSKTSVDFRFGARVMKMQHNCHLISFPTFGRHMLSPHTVCHSLHRSPALRILPQAIAFPTKVFHSIYHKTCRYTVPNGYSSVSAFAGPSEEHAFSVENALYQAFIETRLHHSQRIRVAGIWRKKLGLRLQHLCRWPWSRK